MANPFIYINATLPRTFFPPDVKARKNLTRNELFQLLEVNDVSLPVGDGRNINERILAVFRSPEVLFGDPTFIDTNEKYWLDRLDLFTSKGDPIEFVAMAFPYKVPNPLKTLRKAPDLGEALMLRRFTMVLDAIQHVYAPGARLTILEEGILGRCQGVDHQQIEAYRDGINGIIEISGVNPEQIVFHSLDDMPTTIPNFEARWIHEQERLRELWQQNDSYVRAAYETTFPASITSVPTLEYDPNLLAKAYDSAESDSGQGQADNAIRYVRDYINKVAHRQFFAYRALLSLRDVTGYLDQLRPGALKLTVSPKPENLAVIPVNRWSRVLPYHGVPVLRKDGSWEINYIGSFGLRYGDVEELHWDQDTDSAPIAFRELN
ncbi:MAG: hypothetical protein EPN48_11155 [Microbacteriaceae bacterium]|nr:MAG: hypothetical protein EPN48_11155 [Microbacteriaceae bacterium]